ncbi:MAG TPA: LptF/LptG family permease, partial [Bacteroidales bacterium]|nr:LptF/LptG family permease [Bacteroidales bacterium]
MKIIYQYLIKRFIGPFILTFFLAIFILLMQFLWKYVDDVVGKSLEIHVILEFIFYASASFVSMAMPLAVLLASLMTFGSLGEKYELVAMKSSGIPLVKIMMPIAVFSLLIGIFSFWFA